MSNYNEPIFSIRVIWVTLLIYSVFCVVMSVTISASKWCSVRLFLQMLVRRLICGICVCVHIVVSSTYVFVLFFSFVYHMLPVLLDGTFFLPLRYCYACYISICILNRCNHGNDFSEIKITRFFCAIYIIGKYLRLLLISSLHTYNVRIHEGCYVWSMVYRPVICITSSTLHRTLSEFVMHINLWSFFHFKFCLVSHFPF